MHMLEAWSQEDERAQMKSFVERIYIDRASVVLIGRDANFVDELGRRLVQVLRQEVNLEVLVLFDVTDEKLLERVNQRLATLSVDQARSADGVEQPPQVWVLQVQAQAQLSQVQMLTRLIRDFPAANLSLLLLSTPKVADAFLESPLGRFYAQWRISEAQETAPEPIHPVQAPAVVNESHPESPQHSRMAQMLTALRSPKAPFAVAAVALLLLLISLIAGRR
jgi:hypothetical protein